jgi:hypothetical protein
LQAANVVPRGLRFCRTINQVDRPAPSRSRAGRFPPARSTTLIVRRRSGPDGRDFRPHDQPS